MVPGRSRPFPPGGNPVNPGAFPKHVPGFGVPHFDKSRNVSGFFQKPGIGKMLRCKIQQIRGSRVLGNVSGRMVADAALHKPFVFNSLTGRKPIGNGFAKSLKSLGYRFPIYPPIGGGAYIHAPTHQGTLSVRACEGVS